MLRTFYAVVLSAALSAAAHTPNLAQTQTQATDRWVDYVGADYVVQPNVTYSTANDTQLKLDLYLPRNAAGPTPALLFFHGGGWVSGQKESSVLFLLPYLSLGWAVVNVEYRLANNSHAPAAVEDCRCALRWVTNRAAQYKIDPSKIVLTGDSAGGHLALITGMLPAGTPFDHQCPTQESMRWTSGTEPPLKVAAVVNWFGITDVNQLLEGPDARHYAMEWFGSLNNRAELARQVSPLSHVRAGQPPVITIHGDKDDVVPYSQAVRLHAALGKAGVDNRLVTIPGRGHGDFTREQFISSYDAVREFLRKNGLLPGK